MTAIPVTAFRLTRGRRLALVIGVPLCLLVVAVFGLNLVADLGQGSFPVSYTIPAAARSLTVHGPGEVRVTGSSASGPARMTGTARYSLVRPAVTERTADGVTTVGYGCDLPFGNCTLDATVSAPAAMPVSVSTSSGDATVTGMTGPVTVSGGDGVYASHVSGPLSLGTDSGNIQGTAVTSASVTASSGDGNIEIVFASVPRDVRVNSSSGDITLVLPPGQTPYRVLAVSDSGAVSDQVVQSPSAPDTITARTGSGNITIRYGG